MHPPHLDRPGSVCEARVRVMSSPRTTVAVSRASSGRRRLAQPISGRKQVHSDFFKRGVRHPHTFALLLLLGGQQACSPSPSASSAAGSTDTEGSSTTTNTQTATSGSATLDPQSSNTSDSDVDSGDITTIDSSDHTSESGAQACAGGNRCVPVAPIGWNGPLEALLGERDAACGEAYPEEVTALLLGLRALPSSCDCECAVARDPAHRRSMVASSCSSSSSQVAP